MNYYERHIGDYLKDTSHLSLLEHGIYARLLDVYYTREAGIPVELCERLIGAKSKDERAALAVVLDEFFAVDGRILKQARCDLEIARYQDKQARLRKLRDGGGWVRFRAEVLARDGHRCVYCGTADVPLQLDHIFPRSRGGVDHPDNLNAACKPCNTSKGAKTLEEWGGVRHVR